MMEKAYFLLQIIKEGVAHGNAYRNIVEDARRQLAEIDDEIRSQPKPAPEPDEVPSNEPAEPEEIPDGRRI